jgi:hypothetical protein
MSFGSSDLNLSNAGRFAKGDEDGVACRLDAARASVVPAEWDRAHDLVGTRVDL